MFFTVTSLLFESGLIEARQNRGQVLQDSQTVISYQLSEASPPLPSTKARRYNQPNFHPKEQAMGKINWNRVILGGLVAGVIINVFEFALHGFVLAKDMDTVVRALGREVGGGELLMFLAWGFLVGIFAVWLYAAIRPRYGAGPKTALCAGAAVWGLGYLLAAVGPIALHLFPRHIIAIGLAVGLVEVLVGTVAGAWLYRKATA
jgi:hypothetical protein